MSSEDINIRDIAMELTEKYKDFTLNQGCVTKDDKRNRFIHYINKELSNIYNYPARLFIQSDCVEIRSLHGYIIAKINYNRMYTTQGYIACVPLEDIFSVYLYLSSKDIVGIIKKLDRLRHVIQPMDVNNSLYSTAVLGVSAISNGNSLLITNNDIYDYYQTYRSINFSDLEKYGKSLVKYLGNDKCIELDNMKITKLSGNVYINSFRSSNYTRRQVYLNLFDGSIADSTTSAKIRSKRRLFEC